MFFGIAVGYWIFTKIQPNTPPAQFEIVNGDRWIDPNRLPRKVNRPEEMQQAMTAVASVFQAAISDCKQRQAEVEIRFYQAKEAVPPPKDEGVDLSLLGSDSLQAFQVNPDQTSSPIGKAVVLPEGIQCYAYNCSGMIELDAQKKLYCVLLSPGMDNDRDAVPCFSVNVILRNVKTWMQIPRSDRILTVLFDRLFLDGDSDITGRALAWGCVPSVKVQPSRPVRP